MEHVESICSPKSQLFSSLNFPLELGPEIEIFPKNSLQSYDDPNKRAARMASFGVFWWAPVTSKWMSVLERLVPGKTGAALVKKIFVDQAIFSPFILSAFFTVYESKFELTVRLEHK